MSVGSLIPPNIIWNVYSHTKTAIAICTEYHGNPPFFAFFSKLWTLLVFRFALHYDKACFALGNLFVGDMGLNTPHLLVRVVCIANNTYTRSSAIFNNGVVHLRIRDWCRTDTVGMTLRRRQHHPVKL
jgi:hypothetical protein